MFASASVPGNVLRMRLVAVVTMSYTSPDKFATDSRVSGMCDGIHASDIHVLGIYCTVQDKKRHGIRRPL